MSSEEELELVKGAARDLIQLMHTEMAGDEMKVWAALDRLAPMVGAETCAEFLGVGE